MPTRSEFLADTQGRRFADVFGDPRYNFDQVLTFLDDPARRRRMEEAETIHGRPALAGVVGELEALPDIDAFFQGEDAHKTYRFRQAVGVAVRIVMEELGWSRTGVKGSLGRRAKVSAGTTTPGAYRNLSGPSKWFNKAEHYRIPDGSGGRLVGPGTAPLPRSATDEVGRLVQLPEDERRRRSQGLRRALDALETMGTEQERRETLDALMAGLAETRRTEGRAF